MMDGTTYRNYLSVSCAKILRACLALAAREKLSKGSSWHIRMNMFFGLVISAYMKVCASCSQTRQVCHRMSFVRMHYLQPAELFSSVYL